MIRTTTLFTGLLLLWQVRLLAQIDIQRVDPPFWWTGMEETRLELLVYGRNIAMAGLSLDYPGVRLDGITRVENPNYLFVNLDIGPTTQPGSMALRFTQGTQTLTVSYELKARAGFEGRILGVNTSDFIYLLMPDRFANGDPTNDDAPGMNQPKAARKGQYQRHGGDIQGIIDHLGYLQDLGITTIWPNPVEETNQPYESYHGYATTDHYRVDPRLGNNDLYAALVDSCHARGMKVIRDVVYNHVGNEHWFIRDLPSRDWVHQFDTLTRTNSRAPVLMDPYAAQRDHHLMTHGWFDKHMPDLNQQNAHLATYLIQNSIWWIEHFGVDGYRIDTYAYPDQAFMAQWAQAIWREYPHFTMFAEIWDHGIAVQSWFTEGSNGKAFDSYMPGVTDFQLHFALNDALNQPFGWTEGLARLYYVLAQDYLYRDPRQNVIFLDNHDIGRFYAAVGNDLRKYKMGVGFLLTTRGIPQIYYGTEILMRNPFDWGNHDKVREEFPGGWPGDKVNKFTAAGRTDEENAAFDYLRTLATYRRQSSALRAGRLTQFVPEAGIYVYFRYDDKQTVMVVMNQQAEAVTVPTHRYAERMQGYTRARDVITGQSLMQLDKLTVPGMGILILELE